MQIQTISTENLKPFQRNPKQHPDEQIAKLKKSMQEFGWTNPILITSDHMVIAGHARLQAALELGFTEVPVITLDLPYEKAVAYVIADNRLAELAETDTETLARLLQEISDIPDFDIEAIGYSLDDVDSLLESITPVEVEEDEAPEPPEEPVTQKGDLWEIGGHRLMCGDSTQQSDVDLLMKGDLASLCWTDPPWNVSYGEGLRGGNNALGWKKRTILNDNLGDKFGEFAEQFCNQIYGALVPGGILYMAMSAQEWGLIMSQLEESGFHWSSTIVWAKDSLVVSRKDYHTQYEPVYYGWKNDAPRICKVEDRKQSDLWSIPRPKRSDEHPTMKPIELVARAVANSSRKGDVVLDPFGGSGTTLMACEQIGRINYSIELDPKYCDVIIQRYVNFTDNRDLKLNGEVYAWEDPEEVQK